MVSKTEPGEDGQAQGHDPGSRQDEGKRETRAQVRVRERKCDTPSRPRKGERAPACWQDVRGLEVHMWLEGSRLGTPFIHQGLS